MSKPWGRAQTSVCHHDRDTFHCYECGGTFYVPAGCYTEAEYEAEFDAARAAHRAEHRVEQ